MWLMGLEQGHGASPLAPLPAPSASLRALPAPACYENEAGGFWDHFYRRNGDKFFRNRWALRRRWLLLLLLLLLLRRRRRRRGGRRRRGRRPRARSCGRSTRRAPARAPP